MSELKIDVPALQARNLPHCKWEDVLTVTKGELAADEAAGLNKYLRSFLPPQDKMKCFNCGTSLAGWVGSFTYGLVHGEGFCSSCNYPARVLHEPKGGPLESLKYILQYHPDELEVKT